MFWWYYVDCKKRTFYKFYWPTNELPLYNEVNLDMFVNGVVIYKFKTKDYEMNVVPFVWVMFEKIFQLTIWKILDSMGEISVDYNSIGFDYIYILINI